VENPETEYARAPDAVYLGELKGIADRWHLYRVVNDSA
jgi:hypothetical protein